MSRKLKKSIQKALEAPKPNQQEKERFLRTLPQAQISLLQFILIQAAYVRKRTLVLSLLSLFPALAGANCMELDTLWLVSAFVPFLGLLAVSESTRSMTYGMSEFEMSTRFSLKSVVLARMSVLGLLDTLILCCFIPFCYIHSNASFLQTSFLQTGIYLFVPYLLTVNISLWIVRHFRSKEAMYACMSVAALLSVANVWLHFIAAFVYQLAYVKWWLLLFALLIGAMAHETYCAIKQTEGFAWNL